MDENQVSPQIQARSAADVTSHVSGQHHTSTGAEPGRGRVRRSISGSFSSFKRHSWHSRSSDTSVASVIDLGVPEAARSPCLEHRSPRKTLQDQSNPCPQRLSHRSRRSSKTLSLLHKERSSQDELPASPSRSLTTTTSTYANHGPCQTKIPAIPQLPSMEQLQSNISEQIPRRDELRSAFRSLDNDYLK